MESFGSALALYPSLVVAPFGLGVVLLEAQRRFGLDLSVLRRGCREVLPRHAPEVACLASCLAFAMTLRLRGDTTVITDPAELAVWEEIKAQWPTCLGADTLLGLQAMLRLVVFSTALHRARTARGASPLAGACGSLLFGAALARSALSARNTGYELDGPLGGALPAACEVAGVPLLAALSLGGLQRPSASTAAAVATSAWLASGNYLSLTEDRVGDKLFILAHCLEFFAALAFVARTISSAVSRGGRAVGGAGFTSLVMPFQQLLPAYYFLTALEPSAELVGAGRPFCLLIFVNLLQLAVYLCALAFHLEAYHAGEEPLQDAVPALAPALAAELCEDMAVAPAASAPLEDPAPALATAAERLGEDAAAALAAAVARPGPSEAAPRSVTPSCPVLEI